MSRKNSYEIRERNKPQQLKRSEAKSKRNGRIPHDMRDLFARKMMKVIERMQDE
ncbi:hypothetical protein [Sporosarcina sp. SAFN-010]|uniref:hypothetical protein n=1 Tax=Sporosarcina sp. SAFN-010 TaxID=3387273 RepID=UPI003F8033E5